MITLSNVHIDGLHGRPVTLDLCCPESPDKHPVIIFAHGFKGFKDWGHFNAMMKWFAGEGFAFIKFNFSHNGIPASGGFELSDLDAFSKNNFSIELDDLQVVIDWVEQHANQWNLDAQSINLIGHSRGGGLVMLKATEDKRVKKVVSWAGVTDLGRYWMGDMLEQWLETGVQYVTNSRTGQQLPMGIQFYHDYMVNLERLDLPKRMPLLTQALLHIHGSADEAVPFSWALELKENHPNTILHVMEGSNHVFGSKHPWIEEKMASDVMEVLQVSSQFLKVE